MRLITRWLGVFGAISALVATTAMPAGSAPRPRQDQWWFTAWNIQQGVWPITRGAGVTVAVIDSGVNGNLPEMRGAVLSGTNTINAFREKDGWVGPTSDHDASHGTGMAALIVAQGAGTGYMGVAPEAKILPIISNASLESAMVEGIHWAVDHGSKVISISQAFKFRSGCPLELQQGIAYALERDVVVVAGVGNTGDTTNFRESPADCKGVLAVGAVDHRKRPWVHSQRQTYVSVAAPGSQVNALMANGQVVDGLSGTSQATALTSAVVALVRSKYPRMPAREVVQRIINTTKDVGPPGRDKFSGAGVVIPAAALTADVPRSAPNPVFAAYDRWAKTHPVTAGPTPSVKPSKRPKSAATKESEQATRNTMYLLIGLGVVGVIGAVVLFIAVRKASKSGRSGPKGGSPAAPLGWDGQPGAPPPGPEWPSAGGQQYMPPQTPPSGPGHYPPH